MLAIKVTRQCLKSLFNGQSKMVKMAIKVLCSPGFPLTSFIFPFIGGKYKVQLKITFNPEL